MKAHLSVCVCYKSFGIILLQSTQQKMKGKIKAQEREICRLTRSASYDSSTSAMSCSGFNLSNDVTPPFRFKSPSTPLNQPKVLFKKEEKVSIIYLKQTVFF